MTTEKTSMSVLEALTFFDPSLPCGKSHRILGKRIGSTKFKSDPDISMCVFIPLKVKLLRVRARVVFSVALRNDGGI